MPSNSTPPPPPCTMAVMAEGSELSSVLSCETLAVKPDIACPPGVSVKTAVSFDACQALSVARAPTTATPVTGVCATGDRIWTATVGSAPIFAPTGGFSATDPATTKPPPVAFETCMANVTCPKRVGARSIPNT